MRSMTNFVSLIKISLRCSPVLSRRIVGYHAFERNRHFLYCLNLDTQFVFWCSIRHDDTIAAFDLQFDHVDTDIRPT